MFKFLLLTANLICAVAAMLKSIDPIVWGWVEPYVLCALVVLMATEVAMQLIMMVLGHSR